MLDFVAVPDRDQDIAVPGDEQADRRDIARPVSCGSVRTASQRIAVRERDDRGRDGVRQQFIEFGGVARLQSRLEVPADIPLRGIGRGAMSRAPCAERHPRHQAIGALRQGGQDDDRGLAVDIQIVVPQVAR